MLDLDVRDGRADLVDDLAPQPRGGEDVGLVDARDVRRAGLAASSKASRTTRRISCLGVGQRVDGRDRPVAACPRSSAASPK